jgi:hypothetical protein
MSANSLISALKSAKTGPQHQNPNYKNRELVAIVGFMAMEESVAIAVFSKFLCRLFVGKYRKIALVEKKDGIYLQILPGIQHYGNIQLVYLHDW